MSTDETTTPAADRANGLDIDSARLAAAPEPVIEPSDGVLRGGDAGGAPHSLIEPQLHSIDGDSSGTSWDDPDEL